MHKLMKAAGRRSAGLAAGVILTGGLVGGVLLAPAAYAATATIAINSATPGVGGITVSVSVTNGSDPLGTFSVAGAGSGCTGSLYGGMFGMPSNGNGSGRCTIPSVGAGTYSLVASYDGVYSSPTSVTVGNPSPPPGGNAPVFTADSPSTSVTGQSFSYQFQATNSPSFQLVGAPSWLSIGNSGMVSGNVPNGINSFSFSVKAWNNWGFATAGPFTIFFHHNFFHFAEVNLSTSLSCTSPVFTGQRGTCTLWVTNSNQSFFWGPGGQFNNFGQNFASDVTAQISLPPQLRADFCGFSHFFFNGCQIFGNTATENLGNLRPGHTRSLTVTFTALSGFNLFGRHHGHSFSVRVVGSASSNHGNFNFFGRGRSYSVADVTIIPRGFWW
jgi:hypothetical protein